MSSCRVICCWRMFSINELLKRALVVPVVLEVLVVLIVLVVVTTANIWNIPDWSPNGG